jgi:molybdopterin molybdotransferase
VTPRKLRDLGPPTPFDEAQRIVRGAASPLGVQQAGLADAWGRVLAERIVAPHAVPPFDNSMVDGFALRAADVAGASPGSPVELEVIGEVAAGDTGDVVISPGTAVRIMTGAPVPPTADGIVMLEWTLPSGSRVRVERETSPGRFIRRAGEDVRAGDVVLEPGRALGAAEAGMLASLGYTVVRVHRRPRVAILVTGDELLAVGEDLAPGKIRSSNNWTIAGQVREAGGEVEDLGIGRDDPRDLARRIGRAGDADVLVTSGGVSVGDHDEVQDVLVAAGLERLLWRVAASPGKPLLFGRLGAMLVFGLPGNPVSSMVCFENFVRPVLRILQGDARPDRPRARARLLEPMRGAESRRHFARVRVACAEGGFVAREVRPLGSGNLRSMVHANGLAIVPEGRAVAEAGESVAVMLLGPPDPEGEDATVATVSPSERGAA